mgnify:CR=1 FL=1
MSKARKSFIIHHDSLNVLDDLTDEQAGVLFKAIKDYQLDNDVEVDMLTKIALSPFINQFKRDDSKYENLCEKNRLIAETRYNTKSTTGTSGRKKAPKTPEPTKSTDNDSDSDSKSDNDNDSKSIIKDLVAVAPKFHFKNELLNLGVDSNTLDDWLNVRKKKKAANTKTAFDGLLTEVKKAGLNVDQAVKISAANSWAGFKASWYERENPTVKQYSDTTAQNIKNLEGGW